MNGVRLAPASPEDWPLACRWALGHAPADQLGGRVERLLGLIQVGGFDPAGLILARRSGVPVGGIAAQVHPGGAGVLIPPFAAEPSIGDALVHASLEHFRQREVVLAHCMLPPEDAALAAPLLRGGFQLITQILHLVRQGSLLPAPTVAPPADLRFVPYSDALESIFADTLARTYIGSADLPETTVDRPATQLLAGYRHGQPDPPHWWLVENAVAEPVGVVLLSELGPPGVWEIGYLGLVPEARGRGWGRGLIRHAVAMGAAAKIFDLGLSVDSRNSQASRLYRDQLFRIYGSEDLYLVRLSSTT